MTLGEFRKFTEHLSDDIKLAFHYGGDTFLIGAMDALGDDTIVFCGNIYGEDNLNGSLRVATFLKSKENEQKTLF